MSGGRILILRPDNIGDVVLFSGALRHIRNLFPNAYITLAVKHHIVNLVELCPYIDACASAGTLTWWDRIKSVKIISICRIEGIIRYLNRVWNSFFCTYDVIIYPVKSPQPEHLKIIRDLNVKRIFGITGCNINAPQGCYPSGFCPNTLFTDRFDVSHYYPWRHEFFTTLDFLRFLECEVSGINDIRPDVWISDSDRNLLENALGKDQKIIGIFPGGSFKEKCWSPDNYENLGSVAPNTLFVIFGDSGDTIIADLVESFLVKGSPNAKIINLVGKTRLRELYKTISACNLVISMDTSGLHLAITSGVPTIGIVGGWHYGRFIPWGDHKRHVFLTKKLQCFQCNLNCKINNVCVQGVAPETVIFYVKKLLAI